MKMYLAGPMRGYAHFNFPAFNNAAKWLREQGHVVFNPAEKDVEIYGESIASSNAEGSIEEAKKTHGFDLRKAMATDLTWLCLNAEAIALLPGWQFSRGARAEHMAAEALGLEVCLIPKDVTRAQG